MFEGMFEQHAPVPSVALYVRKEFILGTPTVILAEMVVNPQNVLARRSVGLATVKTPRTLVYSVHTVQCSCNKDRRLSPSVWLWGRGGETEDVGGQVEPRRSYTAHPYTWVLVKTKVKTDNPGHAGDGVCLLQSFFLLSAMLTLALALALAWGI